MKIYLSFLVIFVAVECQFWGQNLMSPHVGPLLGQGMGQPGAMGQVGIPQQAPPTNGGGFDYSQPLEEQNRRRCRTKWDCNHIGNLKDFDPEVCCLIMSAVNGRWDWQCISRSLSTPGGMRCT